jgi:photosystem II stability/assembly factor-like uncharacterized protein
MKKHISLSAICFLLLAIDATITAQDWISMMKNPNSNVHDVQKAFYAKNKAEKERKEMGKSEPENGYEIFKRWENIMEPRTFPTGKRPDPSIFSKEYNPFFSAKNAGKIKSGENILSSANWVYKGNTGVPINGGGDGRINKLRFYPGNSSIMFACAPTGGLWKTTDGGATWLTNTDQIAELGTSDLAIDPINPNIMYLATGDCDGPGADFWSLSTIGVLKSINGGTTWNPTGLSYTQSSTGPAYGTVTELALNPQNTGIIIAATSTGMYYSSDSGNIWTQEDTEYFKSVEFEPFHPSTVYASTGNGKFFRSTDGGVSYSQITNGLPASGLTARMTIAVTPADSNYVYLVAEDALSKSFYGLYCSTDRGQTFSQQSNYSSAGSLGIAYGWYGLPLAVSPTNVDTILTGGIDIYMSTDGGVTWNISASSSGSGAPYAHADGHHLTFIPGSGISWFDACDGGVFQATNGGLTYTDLSNNLQIAEIYAIGASSITSGLWLSGWQDNGINESGNPWSQVQGADGMVPFIDYSNDNNMYCETQDGALYNSFNGGSSWNYIASSITENGPWVTRWMQDPKSVNTLFAGFSNVWMSTNQGNNWSRISSFSSSTSLIKALIVDPANDRVLYTCWHDSIFMTNNQGSSWKNITSNLPVSVAWMTGIALDPNNSSHAWVTFSGYVDTAKVFQTYNGGTSWINISSGLPNLPVNCIVFQPGNHSAIYIGTDDGIYYRDTLLNSWIPFNSGLPDVMVNDLKIVDANTNLLAATYGRGVWETPVYTSTTGVSELKVQSGGVSVFPNPASTVLSVVLSQTEKANFELYNEIGEQVITNYELKITASIINVSNLPEAIYFYRVLKEDGELMGEGKVVIIR